MDQMFCNKHITLTVMPGFLDGWNSEEQKKGYFDRARDVFAQYQAGRRELSILEFELSEWKELKWEDVFHPEDCLRGVSYDTDRVQTSSISDQPYQMVALAETKLKQNEKQRTMILRDMERVKRRMEYSRKMLDILRGNVRKVAECCWYSDTTASVENIAEELMVSESTVKRLRAEAIETVALYLKRRDARCCERWLG